MNPYDKIDIAPDAPCEGWEGRAFPDPVCPLRYRFRAPTNPGDGPRPLVLVMHGAGSIGDDNRRQLFIANLFAQHAPEAANAFLVAPQCPAGRYWVPCAPDWDAEDLPLQVDPAAPLAAVMRLMEKLLAELPVDFSRIYLVGASMGGYAAWELLFRRAWFAAAVIICGRGDPRHVSLLGLDKVRLFHGEADPVVPVAASRQMAAASEQIEYTEYPGLGHDAWTPALSDPDTGAWLFAQRKFSMVRRDPCGPETVTLENAGFRALVAPGAGGNLYSLRDRASGRALLREPLCRDQLCFTPVCFGLPALFPPTRIPGGRFVFNGREYQLPLNEVNRGNHLHGLVAAQAWEVVSADGDRVTLRYRFTPADPRFPGFPHEFTLERTYRLTDDGLEDVMKVTNHSAAAMPLGLGYHSAFNAVGATVRLGAADYELVADENVVTTGERRPWREVDPRQDFDHRGHDFDFHTPIAPVAGPGGRSFRGAVLTAPEGTLCYELDDKFGFWFLWNGGGFNDFVCMEPLSWMGNTPNLKLPREETGWRELAPGASATFANRIRWARR